MNNIKDGGPAFPSTNDITVGDAHSHGHSGMTLRDWFAGQALAGIMAECESSFMARNRRFDYRQDESRARQAYEIADAMIAERENNAK